MERSYDVVIVGGGVMGCSAAYWLAANRDFSGSILIVERDPTYATATTALLGRLDPPAILDPRECADVALRRLAARRAQLSLRPLAARGPGPRLRRLRDRLCLVRERDLVLAHRVPAFAEIKLQSAWAGLYEYNTFDQNAIVGPHPEIANLVFPSLRFSGHGVQQSPAAGRAISESITYGAYKSLDLGRLSYDRIAAGAPIKEINVV